MRIEELILGGFKSYPVRTQITGWDLSFKTITGLNGSGKSNILDAICFVLGLTNMSFVRILHHLCNISLLIICPSLRCVRRTNRISYINVVKPASQRHLSP
jgi:predicted ATP-binding protein involved in virulence